MTWRAAPSVGAALAEANVIWPQRNRSADGIIASAAHHQQNPTSDHEPDSREIVHAFDITAAGIDIHDGVTPKGDDLVATMIARKDARVAYVIWARHIWRAYAHNGSPAWTPSAYTGPSPHTEHVHVSIWSDLNEGAGGHSGDTDLRNRSEADVGKWWMRPLPPQPPPPPPLPPIVRAFDEEDAMQLATRRPTAFQGHPTYDILHATRDGYSRGNTHSAVTLLIRVLDPVIGDHHARVFWTDAIEDIIWHDFDHAALPVNHSDGPIAVVSLDDVELVVGVDRYSYA